MKLLGPILVVVGALLAASDASARPRGHRGGGPRHPTVHHRPAGRPVARPVHRPGQRHVARPQVRDHRGAVHVRPHHHGRWWGPYYRRPYHRSYWPYFGYYDHVYYPYPVAPAGYATVKPGSLGVGLSLSRFDGRGDLGDGGGLGGAVRWRGDRVELELEVAGQRHPDDEARRDRRIGGNLYFALAHHRTVTPYLVGGLGVNHVEREIAADRNQAYVAGGAGLAFPLGRSVTLSGDVRWHARWALEDDRRQLRAAGTTDPIAEDDERLLEARLGLMIYF